MRKKPLPPNRKTYYPPGSDKPHYHPEIRIISRPLRRRELIARVYLETTNKDKPIKSDSIHLDKDKLRELEHERMPLDPSDKSLEDVSEPDIYEKVKAEMRGRYLRFIETNGDGDYEYWLNQSTQTRVPRSHERILEAMYQEAKSQKN